MITVGVDPHKQLNVAAAVDQLGRPVGEWSGPNSREGWEAIAAWLDGLGAERQLGVEGSGSYGRGLSQYLLSRGERVYDVNPRLTAGQRRRARKTDKNDVADGIAIALVVLREGEKLPHVAKDDETSILAFLSAERSDLLQEANRVRNRLHATLHRIDPQYQSETGKLTTKRGMETAASYQSPIEDATLVEFAASARRLAIRLIGLVAEAKMLGKRIAKVGEERYLPLTAVCGIQALTAGDLAGILGRHPGLKNDAQLAALGGVAPIEASSAGKVRHRLNRGGNRRLNSIFYRIAIVQLRRSADAKAYVERRLSEGKTKREAIRALKRYIVRAVFRAWQQCTNPPLPGLAT